MQKNQNSVLPTECRDFMTKNYWEKFFKRIKKESGGTEYFEWYGEYASFDHLFKKYLHPQSQVLHVGIGKSLLAEQIYDAGLCKYITNVDFEQKSLDQMETRSKQSRPEMKFQCFSLLDVTLPLADQYYDAVIDKGTLDAMYPHSLKETNQIAQYYQNMCKILKPGGVYILISLLQDHILSSILDFFLVINWKVTVYETLIEKSKLYPFFVVIQKPSQQQEESKQSNISEVQINFLNCDSKYLSKHELIKQIKRTQLQNHFITQVHKLRQGQTFTLDLWSSINKSVPRYTLFIYDTDNAQQLLEKTCGCFILPNGKEKSFIFGTPNGHRELQKQSHMSRLIVARMNAGHIFESLKTVQQELSPAIEQLTPKGCTNKPCPFMADGDEIGDRKILFESEDLIVEELISDQDMMRRLVLQTNIDQTQSQVRLKQIPKSQVKDEVLQEFNEVYLGPFKLKPNNHIVIDRSYLDFQAHIAMVAGLSFISKKLETQAKILILGGGTGTLSHFITDHYSNTKVKNIEISEEVIWTAKRYFEFSDNERETILCADALQYVEMANQSREYDCIIIDINSSDPQSPSPPASFLTQEFLNKIQTLLTDQGESLLMINVIDRFGTLKTLDWDIGYSVKCEDDLNEVYFLPNIHFSKGEDGKSVIELEKINQLNESIQFGTTALDKLKTKPWDPILNIQEYAQQIKLKWPKISNKVFSVNEVNVITQEGQIQEAGQRKEFYQQDLQKVQKKKNNRKKVNKNR